MWDTSTWSWHGMNEFNLTAVDPAGNWNHANLSMVYDPWALSNEGPIPQLSFDSMRLLEWGDAHVPVEPNPYSINLGEVIVSRLFDGYEICLSVFAPSGVLMENQCQIDAAPPWDEPFGSNRPVMEENRFQFNFTNWLMPSMTLNSNYRLGKQHGTRFRNHPHRSYCTGSQHPISNR